ncbi:uncharacterized protein LOC119127540 [Xyrichtys novacula]|uniref:Uncharacterized protein LOC119127540 n=1 Tax=Xyrichtys novacula TaxID=13765 RepID=A0AAV1FAM3_XYRNO|nr:uncharacterized protein LOC119127540 [Xyrichtys novacula]
MAPQSVCIALRFYASGTYLYTVGDAEHLSKATVCGAIQRVSTALTELLDGFVAFPGHLPIQEIKEGFYTIAALHLKMEPDEADAIRFSRVHHLGKAKGDQQKPRPIGAKVTDSKMKSSIMSKGKELKNTVHSVSDQFPAEIMRRRRLLYPIMADARKSKKNFIELYIDGKLYRNPRVTYWLSCSGDEIVFHDTLEDLPCTSCLSAPVSGGNAVNIDVR